MNAHATIRTGSALAAALLLATLLTACGATPSRTFEYDHRVGAPANINNRLRFPEFPTYGITMRGIVLRVDRVNPGVSRALIELYQPVHPFQEHEKVIAINYRDALFAVPIGVSPVARPPAPPTPPELRPGPNTPRVNQRVTVRVLPQGKLFDVAEWKLVNDPRPPADDPPNDASP